MQGAGRRAAKEGEAKCCEHSFFQDFRKYIFSSFWKKIYFHVFEKNNLFLKRKFFHSTLIMPYRCLKRLVLLGIMESSLKPFRTLFQWFSRGFRLAQGFSETLYYVAIPQKGRIFCNIFTFDARVSGGVNFSQQKTFWFQWNFLHLVFKIL